ncbi:hypothetical protein SEA_JUMBO_2 [Gordonia phage Jumbo]|uniref:Uncharacterized protein n=1 Tax=Gordonia phage Jumbo TaxID=1887650 RepID=A0A1B3B0L3_9CAUD|nr:hypothetical protein BIZ69_gp002 [Gordonia phage Jumbo]AOE44516.1 hypothetical protein SEA_JUMBO_2 [Gordonia phage Jumbo]
MNNEPEHNITEKECTKCHETLPIQYFNRDATRKDGYRNICKTCNSSYAVVKPGFVKVGAVDPRTITGKLKQCSKCGEKKDQAYFSLDKTKVDGRKSACKACRKKDWQNYVQRRNEESGIHPAGAVAHRRNRGVA